MIVRVLLAFAAAGALAAQDRPPRAFREDFKELPPATPVTQRHLANPDLLLNLYGPGREGIKASHHDKPADDPWYIWSGTANGNWAVALRHRTALIDLTGQAKLKWRTKQSGFRRLRVIVKLAGGAWLVSGDSDGPSLDWREREFGFQDIRWRKLNIDTVIEGEWVAAPDLSRVEEIGWTDLMTGGGTPASSRVDWIEVYGKLVPRPSAGASASRIAPALHGAPA